MRDHYLIHGANALSGALSYLDPTSGTAGIRYDPRSVQVFLSTACATLKLLQDDPESLELIEKAFHEPRAVSHSDLSAFIGEFRRADEDIMIKAGMNEKMAKYLFQDAENILLMFGAQAPASAGIVRNRLNDMCSAVCGESAGPDSTFNREAHLRNWINVIGGTAIVVTNATSMAILGDLTGSLSQLFGSILAERGVGALGENFESYEIINALVVGG
jgi:hypothetical protein